MGRITKTIVFSALCVNSVFAETVNDTAVLDTITVTDHQGLKVQSNLDTYSLKNKPIHYEWVYMQCIIFTLYR